MIITILRKSLDGSVTDNTTKHGCGALNIDDTRVRGEIPSVSFIRKVNWKPNTHGRWPANVILTHKDGCELKGTKKVKANIGGGIAKTTIGGHSTYSGGRERVITHYADKDGKEIIANWSCVEDCPVKTLDRQSGVSKSTGGRIGNKDGGGIYGGGKGLKGSYSKGESGFGDEGGASRYFKQFKKEDN